MREFRMEFTFMVESMIHGYHEYKTVWENPVLAEGLRCTREIGNPPLALALSIEDDGTSLHNDLCGFGNFLSVSSTLR